MHENNKDRNPHEVAGRLPMRAEIVIRFDVPEKDASQDYLNAIVGTIRKELKGQEEFANMTTEVEGNWL